MEIVVKDLRSKETTLYRTKIPTTIAEGEVINISKKEDKIYIYLDTGYVLELDKRIIIKLIKDKVIEEL